jgi:hypothetical protein
LNGQVEPAVTVEIGCHNAGGAPARRNTICRLERAIPIPEQDVHGVRELFGHRDIGNAIPVEVADCYAYGTGCLLPRIRNDAVVI